MRKLKQSEIPNVRQEMLEAQDYRCAICGERINNDPVLDHCHRTGHIRAVLHRECNVIEGKFANWFKSYGKNRNPNDVLDGLKIYWAIDFSHNPLHPKHMRDKDRQLKDLRRRLKRAKRKTTQERLRNEIKEIKEKL